MSIINANLNTLKAHLNIFNDNLCMRDRRRDIKTQRQKNTKTYTYKDKETDTQTDVEIE